MKLKMNVEKLEKGLRCTYKELCEILGIEYKQDTRDKERKLKYLGSYCKYKKLGRDILITEVFDEHKEIKNNTGKNGKYTDIMTDIIENIIIKDRYYTTTELALELGMINAPYIKYMTNYKLCSEDMFGIESYVDVVQDTFQKCYNVVFKAISTKLKSYDKEGILQTSYRLIRMNGVRDIATEEECSIINNIKIESLEEMGFKNETELRLKNKYVDFYKLCLFKANNTYEMKIKSFSKVYRLTYKNKKKRMKEETVNNLKYELNRKLVESINRNIEEKFNSSLIYEDRLFVCKNDIIQMQQQIVNYVVKTSLNILDDESYLPF